jgi:hypothetical protein
MFNFQHAVESSLHAYSHYRYGLGQTSTPWSGQGITGRSSMNAKV